MRPSRKALFLLLPIATCVCIAILQSPIWGKSPPQPKSYEEAYHMAYQAVGQNPKEAIRIIKNIHVRNIPVTREDTFYVSSLASLAIRPAFREITIGKELLQKVVAVKPDDFTANSLLFFLSLHENNNSAANRYASNLLMADYEGYIRQMEPASQSDIPEVKDYVSGVVDLYQNLSSFLLDQRKEKDARSAMAIAERVRAKHLKNPKGAR